MRLRGDLLVDNDYNVKIARERAMKIAKAVIELQRTQGQTPVGEGRHETRERNLRSGRRE